VVLRDARQHAAACAGRIGEVAAAEGRVAHHRDAVLLAPGQHGVLDGPLVQVVEDLIARDPVRPRDGEGAVEILDVEVADAPGQDLARPAQVLEARDRLRQRVLARPVQQVAVQPIRPQAAERGLAGPGDAPARRVARHHLRDEEHLLAAIRDGGGDDRLRVAVHLRGVDMGHAGVDPGPQRPDRVRPVRTVDVPRALADDRHRDARRAEAPGVHGSAPFSLSQGLQAAVRSCPGPPAYHGSAAQQPGTPYSRHLGALSNGMRPPAALNFGPIPGVRRRGLAEPALPRAAPPRRATRHPDPRTVRRLALLEMRRCCRPTGYSGV
jgi:hypothetical protein